MGVTDIENRIVQGNCVDVMQGVLVQRELEF